MSPCIQAKMKIFYRQSHSTCQMTDYCKDVLIQSGLFTYSFSPVHLRNYFLPSPPHNALLLISFLLFSVMFLLCSSVVVLNANEFTSDLAFCEVSL